MRLVVGRDAFDNALAAVLVGAEAYQFGFLLVVDAPRYLVRIFGLLVVSVVVLVGCKSVLVNLALDGDVALRSHNHRRLVMYGEIVLHLRIPAVVARDEVVDVVRSVRVLECRKNLLARHVYRKPRVFLLPFYVLVVVSRNVEYVVALVCYRLQSPSVCRLYAYVVPMAVYHHHRAARARYVLFSHYGVERTVKEHHARTDGAVQRLVAVKANLAVFVDRHAVQAVLATFHFAVFVERAVCAYERRHVCPSDEAAVLKVESVAHCYSDGCLNVGVGAPFAAQFGLELVDEVGRAVVSEGDVLGSNVFANPVEHTEVFVCSEAVSAVACQNYVVRVGTQPDEPNLAQINLHANGRHRLCAAFPCRGVVGVVNPINVWGNVYVNRAQFSYFSVLG